MDDGLEERVVSRAKGRAMDLSPPVTVAKWRTFLSRHSSEFLESDYLRRAEADDRADGMVSPTQRASGWLGYEPADERAILAAEERLGVALPPSYRNFLLVSNGWNCLSYTIDLLGVAEIGWFPNENPGLYEVWVDWDFTEDARVLNRSLLISKDDGGSGGNWLLHEGSVAENGEWTAYEWWPGEGGILEPHTSFAEMVIEAHQRAVES